MRKLGAVALAVPILVAIYFGSVLRRGTAGRIVGGFAAFAIVGLVLLVSLPPARTAAVPAGSPAPIGAEVLASVRTGFPLASPFTVRFGAPMDAASVAAAVRVQPDSAVSLGWDAAGTSLSISPVGHWQPDTLYTVTVGASARASSGAPIASPIRAVILTAGAGSGTIAATRLSGTRARLDTAFRLTFDTPVALTAVRAALRSTPAVAGTVTAGSAPNEFLFTPTAPLAPATRYRLSVAGVVDAAGVALRTAPSIDVTTVRAPGVVRFRPRNGTADVTRAAAISVRFTERMNTATTAKAVHVLVNGKAVTGKVTWVEQGTVLVFDPTADLPFGAGVAVTVDASATSRVGVPVARAITGTFRVAAKPKPAPKAAAPKHHVTKPIKHSGGGGAVAGSWTSVESYYLHLMNCTRTGGWVTSGGSCSSPGGRNVAALSLSSGISAQVSRPYAKMLATTNQCDHFVGGNPGDRLRRAGYDSYRWAENLGCRSGNAYSAVLGSHLFFQAEKSSNGGHYVNLMNAAYDRVGIGVWVSGGRVRLVVDFYHP